MYAPREQRGVSAEPTADTPQHYLLRGNHTPPNVRSHPQVVAIYGVIMAIVLSAKINGNVKDLYTQSNYYTGEWRE
jgi:hypothetical protein